MSDPDATRPEVKVFGAGIIVMSLGALFFGVSFLTHDYFTRLWGTILMAVGSTAIALALLCGECRSKRKEQKP